MKLQGFIASVLLVGITYIAFESRTFDIMMLINPETTAAQQQSQRRASLRASVGPSSEIEPFLNASHGFSASVTLLSPLPAEPLPHVASNPTLLPIVLAAMVSSLLMYPVDVLRALSMSSMSSGGSKKTATVSEMLAEFRQKFGMFGLCTQGLVPAVSIATISRTIKFFFYPVAHEWISGGQSAASGNTITRVIAGCIATVPEVVFVLPLELVKLTLQLDSASVFGNSASRVLSHLTNRHGFATLYLGWLTVQLRQASWSAVYFCTVIYFTDLGKSWVESFTGSPPLPGSTGAVFSKLLGGFLAGVLGVCFNNPFDVGRTVLQKDELSVLAFGEARAHGASPPVGLQVLFDIAKRRGYRALWAGFTFKAVHLGGSGALMNVLLPAFSYLCGFASE